MLSDLPHTLYRRDSKKDKGTKMAEKSVFDPNKPIDGDPAVRLNEEALKRTIERAKRREQERKREEVSLNELLNNNG